MLKLAGFLVYCNKNTFSHCNVRIFGGSAVMTVFGCLFECDLPTPTWTEIYTTPTVLM